MTLEKSVEALAPVRPATSRSGQRRPEARSEGNGNAGREFSRMLQGQGLRAEAARSQASDSAEESAASQLQRRRDEQVDADADDTEAASPEGEGSEAEGPRAARALKLQLTAEDLGTQPST
ncbi:hypothetical protein, partial [Ideonella sp.]|uniref:hypothetical protein n=1 Tax=Ideonella sp. TaxID=1929293 RepID=UPI003BB4C3C0